MRIRLCQPRIFTLKTGILCYQTRIFTLRFRFRSLEVLEILRLEFIALIQRIELLLHFTNI